MISTSKTIKLHFMEIKVTLQKKGANVNEHILTQGNKKSQEKEKNVSYLRIV